ncbi:MAG: helix-turn-helix domain-containing protein [Thalassovita sp.]
MSKNEHLKHYTSKISAKLRATRLAQDYSQQAVADILGTSLQQYQKCEYGTAKISAPYLSLLAKEWSVPISTFFVDPKQDSSDSVSTVVEDIHFLVAYANLTPVVRNSVRELIIALSKENKAANKRAS